MYLGGLDCLFTKTQDKVWDFFEKLAWDTYEFEQARNNFGYPTHSEFVFPVSPCPQDPFIDSHDSSRSYLPSVCIIIVSLLTMLLVTALIELMWMLHVQVLKGRLMN